MPSLTDYKGLQVVSPEPVGDGGLAIQNDFKSLVDWNPRSVWAESADPTVDDDETADFYPGSMWLRTDTTPPKLFVCESADTAAAVWRPVLLNVAQDTAPQLGGNLDVNGQQIISADDGDIVLAPDGSGCVGIGTETPSSPLTVAGSIATAVATLTSAGTLTAADSVVLCDSTSASLTITLPSAVDIAGREYRVKRMNGGANDVTIAADGSETIDGASTLILATQYEAATLISDGSHWWRF